MPAQENTKVVQEAYAAFARGDMLALLGAVSDDVDWHGVIGVGENVPMRGARKGRAAVGEFFAKVVQSVEFEQFEPREYLADRDQVVALGFYQRKARTTGRSFASDWVMVFTLRDGKVVRFREYLDAGAVTAAF